MKKTLLPLAMLAGLAGSARSVSSAGFGSMTEFFSRTNGRVARTVAKRKYRTNVGKGFYPAGSEDAQKLLAAAAAKRKRKNEKRLSDFGRCMQFNPCNPRGVAGRARLVGPFL